jgi:hypothetical protein
LGPSVRDSFWFSRIHLHFQWTKYFSQYSVLKYSEILFISVCQRPGFASVRLLYMFSFELLFFVGCLRISKHPKMISLNIIELLVFLHKELRVCSPEYNANLYANYM